MIIINLSTDVPPDMSKWEFILWTAERADRQSIAVAIVLTILSFIGAAINCTVIFAIWRARLLQREDPLYILSTFAMIDPTIRMFYCGIVWSPSDVFKYSIFNKDVSDIFSMSSMAFFMQTSIVQLLIALNRYFLVTSNSWLRFCTRRFYVIYCCCSFPFSQIIFALIYKIFGCCRFIYNPDSYALYFEEPAPGHFDYISNYLYLPMCVLCSTAPVYCYLRIFFITRAKVLDPSVRTLEFSLIFVIYIMFFVGLKFHTLLPPDTPRWVNALVMVLGIMDATSISVIQATMNKRIRRSVQTLFDKRSRVSSTTMSRSVENAGSSTEPLSTVKSNSKKSMASWREKK